MAADIEMVSSLVEGRNGAVGGLEGATMVADSIRLDFSFFNLIDVNVSDGCVLEVSDC
jgi:hypothetical protein